jgi:hypothetical protein
VSGGTIEGELNWSGTSSKWSLISYVAPREHIFALLESTDDQVADSDSEDRKHDQDNHCKSDTEIECRVRRPFSRPPGKWPGEKQRPTCGVSGWRGDLDSWSVKSGSECEGRLALLIHHACTGAGQPKSDRWLIVSKKPCARIG